MSDEWVITPPFSPVLSTKSFEENSENELVNSLCDKRMFCCMGEPHNANITFHDESYFLKNDMKIFWEEDFNRAVFVDNFGPLYLFGHKFDKGSALVKDLSTLFKLAKYFYMKLDSVAKSNVNSLGMNIINQKNTNSGNCREEIINFLLYIRYYILRVASCSKFKWIAENLFRKLAEELNSFHLLCGSVKNIPDYIINYSANNSGNKCNQPSYHLFHCQLDVKWLHITILYQLISYKQRLKTAEYSEEYDESLSFDKLEKHLQCVISDLVIIALKRFQQIASNDFPVKCLFTCTCVRELWKLLQLSIDLLHTKGHCLSFWDYVNKICENIDSNSTSKPAEIYCSKLHEHQKYSCSSPATFILLLLKHLAKLYKIQNESELKSNYELLENTIKKYMNSDVPEFRMRLYLNLVENILDIGWEMKTEPLVLFWEYFHKRLNSSFFMADSSLNSLAVISKSALGLLSQLHERLDSQSSDKNMDMDSFNLFLRLMGRNLRKWQNTPRFWNQLKGRIFSKFSASKLLMLNETGLYHFIALFLTLAITADLQEVSGKLQSFLKLLPVHEMDQPRIKLIWKAHIALILLHAERNQDISVVSSPILDMIEIAAGQRECLDYMRIYSEGFQDLVECTNNLELGQYMFIGNWISTYLLNCEESDVSRFLDSQLSLIIKLNSIMSAQLPISSDNQLILMYNALWEHLVPYLKKISIRPSSPYQISDIAAMLTMLSLKPCFSYNTRSRAIDLFTYFVTYDMIDVRLLCRYLGQIVRIHQHHSLKNHSIILIKGWLRCSILLSNSDVINEDLLLLTTYIIKLPELDQLLSETNITVTEHNDCFENFLIALELKYSSVPDPHFRLKFSNQVSSYFSNIDHWLSYNVKVPSSVTLAMNIYNNVGQMFYKIPYLLYTRSKPNNLLQSFLEILLLPMQIRKKDYRLNPQVGEAIKNALHLYIRGLYKLDPENDTYISRVIRELITEYVPRLVTPKGTILAYGTSQFSLLKCFEFSEQFDLMSKSIMEIICNTFLKKRSKTPHQFAFQALIFFNNLVRYRQNNDEIIKAFIKNAFPRICDVLMFCDEIDPCKKEAKEILQFILDMHLVRTDPHLGNDLMDMFSKLCHEHLAFSSQALFNLFQETTVVAPDLVARFLPQFEEKIKEVECKRGVGFDRSLRKGLERIQESLKNIRNNQTSNSFF